jgi:hypothetical protein
MPDPAATAAMAPEAADGSLPVVILADGGKSRWFAAGHLRYWLQIPVPRFDGNMPGTAVTAAVILFNAGAESPTEAFSRLAGASASQFGPPAPVPFFRPGEVSKLSGKEVGPWFLSRR